MNSATTAATRPLTSGDIDTAATDPRWDGWGYLGEEMTLAGEHGTIADDAIAAARRAILDQANARGWNADRLFAWLNSRASRHFADQAFSGRRQALAAEAISGYFTGPWAA